MWSNWGRNPRNHKHNHFVRITHTLTICKPVLDSLSLIFFISLKIQNSKFEILKNLVVYPTSNNKQTLNNSIWSPTTEDFKENVHLLYNYTVISPAFWNNCRIIYNGQFSTHKGLLFGCPSSALHKCAALWASHVGVRAAIVRTKVWKQSPLQSTCESALH